METDACEETSGQINFAETYLHCPFRLGCSQRESVVGCALPTWKQGLCFPTIGGTGSQGFTSSQGQLLAQLQGAPFNCMRCHWHPLEPSSWAEAPVCLGNRETCLGKGPWAISLGAGRKRTFTGFLPSRGPQTAD